MKLEHPTLALSHSPHAQSVGVAMLLTDEEEAEGENDISLIVPRAVAKLVKHFAVFSLSPSSPISACHFIHFMFGEAN